MDLIIQQVKQLAGNADAVARHNISYKLRELAATIETPRETMFRYAYSYTNSAVCQTAADLKLFDILVDSHAPLTVDAVADKSRADPVLIRRLLRYLASALAITETGKDTFAANETTRILAAPSGRGSIGHGFHFVDRCLQELPNFLKANNYVSKNDGLHTPFHVAFKATQPAFHWVQSHPLILENFLSHFQCVESPRSWTTSIPLATYMESAEKTAPLFVDVGGGLGLQCVAFKQAILKLVEGPFEGRLIHQDLPETLNQAPCHEGVEKMAQDFFKGQAVEGAAIYYIRNVLHDHSDERCLEILKNQVAAMGPSSVLLIDELIVPDTGASIMATQSDITMMTVFGARERTKSEWLKLLDEAGLRIVETYEYDSEMGHGVVEAVPRNRHLGLSP